MYQFILFIVVLYVCMYYLEYRYIALRTGDIIASSIGDKDLELSDGTTIESDNNKIIASKDYLSDSDNGLFFVFCLFFLKI